VGRPIVFLSDLGTRDESVGVCRLVVERMAPGTTIVDLSHGVPPQDVLTGAILLADALPFMPQEAVVLAVVDPGSGTDRRAVALETEAGCSLVGPDNGLLSLAWPALGGVRRAVEISSPDVIMHSESRVLDAREVFAPAAAWLASGRPLEDLGPAVDPESLATRRLVEPEVETHLIKGEVLDVDRFGNVRLNLRPTDLERAELAAEPELQITTPATSARARRVATYRDVAEGELGILVDAWRWLSVVRYAESAATALDASPGDLVWIRRPEGA
jgi:S-adenosyl-L-methionine hydrolase (adenosine-forming)